MIRWHAPTVRDRGNDSSIPREKSGTTARGGTPGSGFGNPYGSPSATPRWIPPGARAASAVVFLDGVWLLLAPFVLDYAPRPEGLGAYWNDLVVGGVVALLALVRALAPEHLPLLSLVNAALGAWLLVSPFVLDYAAEPYAMRATGNDVAVGVLVLVVAVASAVTTYQRRKAARGADGAST